MPLQIRQAQPNVVGEFMTSLPTPDALSEVQYSFVQSSSAHITVVMELNNPVDRLDAFKCGRHCQ